MTRHWLLGLFAISRVASADLADDVQHTRGLRFKHPVVVIAQVIDAGSATADVWGVHPAELDAFYDGSAVIAKPDASELAIAAALDRALIEQHFPHLGSGDARAAYDALETADAEVLAIDLSLARAGSAALWSDSDLVGAVIATRDDPAFTKIANARRKGWRAVDRGWAHVPATTSELLHPGTHVGPIELVVQPRPDCALTSSRELGELGARELLEAHGLSQTSAREATRGWQGDRAIACTRANATIAIWRSEWQSEADAERAREAIELAVRDLVSGFVTDGSDGATHTLAFDGTTAVVERRGTSVVAAFGIPAGVDVDPWQLVTRTGSTRAP